LEFSLTVQNYHVATSGPFTIAIRREGSTQTLWSHTMSPLAMDQSITVSATLPAGTQPDSAEEMEFVAYITGGETANSEYEDNNTLIMGTIADRDRDGDGIPNLEELPFGFSPDNPADGQEDSDGDGASNGAEFIAGTDMQNQASRFVVSYFNRAMSASIPGKEDVHLRWPSALGRVYSIEKSSDLRQWTALASSVVATPPLNNHVLQVPLSQLPQFYRISVKYP